KMLLISCKAYYQQHRPSRNVSGCLLQEYVQLLHRLDEGIKAGEVPSALDFQFWNQLVAHTRNAIDALFGNQGGKSAALAIERRIHLPAGFSGPVHGIAKVA